MTRSTTMAGHRRPAGFALVPALFLIVVLAALAAFGVRIYGASQQTVTLSLAGARALAAARAGIEWGAARAIDGDCSAGELALTEGALADFTVSVSCSASNFDEAGVGVVVYDVEAIATQGEYGMPDFVSRRVRASFTAG